MLFEWDDAKARSNKKKHGIGFDVAIQIFTGVVLTAIDDRTDYGEVREVSVGEIEGSVVIVVAHTDRDGTIRIISARGANRKEREKYYEYREKKAF